MTASALQIEISRPGRHRDRRGREVAFSAANLRASAEAYDPAIHEAPLVVGHPRLDAPAYGWVKALAVKGDRLVANPHQVDAQFAEMVNAGRFKKVSAAFYLPDAETNPVPGVYYLKHVGFLGAQAPAVKGLKSVQFAAGDDDQVVTVEFAAASDWMLASAFRSIARLLGGLRDALVVDKGAEAVEQLLPRWELENLTSRAAEIEAAGLADGKAAAFAEPSPTPTPHTQGESMVDAAKAAELASLEAELKRRQDELDARAAEFAERERAARRQENEAFLESLIRDGKFLPAHKAAMVAFMERLDAAEAIEFAEGERKTELQALKDFLAAQPKVVEFAEIAGGDGPSTVDQDDPAVIARRIAEFQETEAKAGRSVSYADAAAAIRKGVTR